MIEIVERVVYRSPTSNRCFLTLRAAIDCEARSLIEKKYPTEKSFYENGYCVDGGWHWTSEERFVRLHKRLKSIISKKFRQSLKVKNGKAD